MSKQDTSAFHLTPVSLGCGQKYWQRDGFNVCFLCCPRQVNKLNTNSPPVPSSSHHFTKKTPIFQSESFARIRLCIQHLEVKHLLIDEVLYFSPCALGQLRAAPSLMYLLQYRPRTRCPQNKGSSGAPLLSSFWIQWLFPSTNSHRSFLACEGSVPFQQPHAVLDVSVL